MHAQSEKEVSQIESLDWDIGEREMKTLLTLPIYQSSYSY